MNEVALNTKQIENMRHCIGFSRDKVKRGKYIAYRNYFTTSDDNLSWDYIVESGLAFKTEFEHGIGDNPQCYYLSKEGFEFLSNLLEVKITEMD